MLNGRIRPFPHKKNTFLKLCSCFRAHPTTLLLKIFGGDGCMDCPPTSSFGGDRPSENSPSEEVRGHWTPTGAEPMEQWMGEWELVTDFIFIELFANMTTLIFRKCCNH